MHSDQMEAGRAIVCALYGPKPGTSMDEVRYNLCTRKNDKGQALTSPTKQHQSVSECAVNLPADDAIESSSPILLA